MNHTKFILINGLAGLVIFVLASFALASALPNPEDSKLNLQTLLPVVAIPSGLIFGFVTALWLIFRQQPNFTKALFFIIAELGIFIITVLRLL
ncbi:hypothetical protein BKI52_26555 [marine bacterium AO1-C]|nr:hypothetical protein BKI52_26555 [marine bacterium AO1-C]